MAEVTEPVGESMMDRRVSTVISWLTSLDLLAKQGTRYVLAQELASESEPVEYEEIEEPLFPRTSLKDYKEVAERARKAQRFITTIRDSAATERADNEHRKLVNLVSNRIRRAGVLPRYNQLVDLAARVDSVPYLFEMKSLTEANARSQIRNGTSQLFEYRYLQDTPEAVLVLVVETPLPNDLSWMQYFLEKDRQVRLLWDGSEQLFASAETKRELSFLW